MASSRGVSSDSALRVRWSSSSRQRASWRVPLETEATPSGGECAEGLSCARDEARRSLTVPLATAHESGLPGRLCRGPWPRPRPQRPSLGGCGAPRRPRSAPEEEKDSFVVVTVCEGAEGGDARLRRIEELPGRREQHE